MLVTIYFYYAMQAVLGAIGIGITYRLLRKSEMKPFAKFGIYILVTMVFVLPLMFAKTAVTIISEKDVTRYALLGEREFEMANGQTIQILTLSEGEVIINNTTDHCVIERAEYRPFEDQDMISELTSVLISIQPMSQYAFHGPEIDYYFETAPDEIDLKDNGAHPSEVKFELRYFKPEDFENYYLYEGPVVWGVPNGKGTLWLSETEYYTGDIVEGKFEGKGESHYDDGSWYKGDFHNDFFEGQGTYYYSDSSVYEGEWIENMATGQGKLEYPSGDVYEGEFSNDRFNGEGTYYFNDGSVYEGAWVDGYMQGFGTITYPSGAYYEGEFYGDLFHGWGKMVYADGSINEGTWDESLFVGED